MSFNRLFNPRLRVVVAIPTSHSYLKRTKQVINGVIVPKFEFATVDHSEDNRNSVFYTDLSLANLNALGQLSQLKPVVAQRNDIDLVINSLENAQSVQTPAETA